MARKLITPSGSKYATGRISTVPNPSFTDREQTVLKLIADGMSNREIAEHLTLSPTTVKWYVKQIFNKLGANRRTEAVKIAADFHLVDFTSSDSPPTQNIPTPLTALIGREGEVNQIIGLLNDSAVRLVTILGAGGIGKTRLALGVAHGKMREMPGQICFVPLDSVTSLSEMIQAIAAGIGFQFHGGLELERQLLVSLRHRKLLLILDNFEHLLEATSFIPEMLIAAPRLKILITSRERLNLSAEFVYSLLGLKFPTNPNHPQEYPAYLLFLQVARSSQATFQVDPRDIPPICRICELVEGMPLAIELAARWIDVLTPAQIAEEIVKGIDLLQTTWQDLPQRHRNIRAVFERSWNLLSGEEQVVFKKLCIFRGGFDRAAAEHVTGAKLFMLSTLVDKSLLLRVGNDRFKLHELVCQFAEEKLMADADAYRFILDEHCRYYAGRMQEYEKKIKTDVSAMSVSVLGAQNDYDNILAGWHHALETPLPAEIGQYAFMISALFQSRGSNSEAEQTFAQALHMFNTADSTESFPIRVRLMTHYGWFLQANNQLERSCQILETALEFAMMLDTSHMADVGLLLGFLASAFILNNQFDAARKNALQGLRTCRTANFQFGVWMCLTILAQVEHSQGRQEAAYEFHHQALIHAEQHRNLYGTIQSLGHLGCTCWALGKVEEALAYMQRGLTLMRNFFIVDTLFLIILGIAGVHEQKGRPDVALELLAILLHHPQTGTPVIVSTVRILFPKLQSRLSTEQIKTVMEQARRGQLSSRYLDPNFTISPELVDELFKMLEEAAKVSAM